MVINCVGIMSGRLISHTFLTHKSSSASPGTEYLLKTAYRVIMNHIVSSEIMIWSHPQVCVSIRFSYTSQPRPVHPLLFASHRSKIKWWHSSCPLHYRWDNLLRGLYYSMPFIPPFPNLEWIKGLFNFTDLYTHYQSLSFIGSWSPLPPVFPCRGPRRVPSDALLSRYTCPCRLRWYCHNIRSQSYWKKQ